MGQLSVYEDVKQLYVDNQYPSELKIFDFDEYKILVLRDFSSNKEISYDGNPIYSGEEVFNGTYFIKVDAKNDYLDHSLIWDSGRPFLAYQDGNKLYAFKSNSTNDGHVSELFSLDEDFNMEVITSTENFMINKYKIVNDNLYFHGRFMSLDLPHTIYGENIPFDSLQFYDMYFGKYDISNNQFDYMIHQPPHGFELPKWDSDGNIHVAGKNTDVFGIQGDYFVNEDTLFSNPNLSRDSYLAKVNSNGQNEYFIPFQEEGNDLVNSVFEIDEFQNTYIAMRFEADTLHMDESFVLGEGNINTALIKIDATGSLKWYNMFSIEQSLLKINSITIGDQDIVINVRLTDNITINGVPEELGNSSAQYIIRMNKESGELLEIDRKVRERYSFSNSISAVSDEGYTHAIRIGSEDLDSFDFGDTTLNLETYDELNNFGLFIYNTTLSPNNVFTNREDDYEDFIYPNIIKDNSLIYIRDKYKDDIKDIALYSVDGSLVKILDKNEMTLPSIATGIYVIAANLGGSSIRQKICVF